MQGNATPQTGTSSGFVVQAAIETFPQSIPVGGTTYSFDADYPTVITVNGWPLSKNETIAAFGQRFWLFDSVNGKLSYGNYTVIGTSAPYVLQFASQEGFPKFDTTLSTGEAHAIPNYLARSFDQCSVKCLSNGEVTVNGVQLTATNEVITIKRNGNLNFPVIIDATDGQASVTNELYTN